DKLVTGVQTCALPIWPVPAAPRSWGPRPIVGVLAPAVAAGVALALHQLLPNRQMLPMSWMDKLPAWRHPYPLLLDGLLAASLLRSEERRVGKEWRTRG